jgi:hypothetical protein
MRQPTVRTRSVEIASGKINTDTLTIEFIEPANGKPAKVAILCPTHPTVCNPPSLDAVIAMATHARHCGNRARQAPERPRAMSRDPVSFVCGRL